MQMEQTCDFLSSATERNTMTGSKIGVIMQPQTANTDLSPSHASSSRATDQKKSSQHMQMICNSPLGLLHRSHWLFEFAFLRLSQLL